MIRKFLVYTDLKIAEMNQITHRVLMEDRKYSLYISTFKSVIL